MYTPFMKLLISSFGIKTILEERCFSIAHTEIGKEERGPLFQVPEIQNSNSWEICCSTPFCEREGTLI